MEKSKKICEKCKGKGYYYDYGHFGETENYHECDLCDSSGYIFIDKKEKNENNKKGR